jgi:hypothetical protein
MPMRSELSAPAMRAAWQKRPAETAWRQASGILRSPDLIVIVAITATGLAATLFAAIFWPSFLNIVAF